MTSNYTISDKTLRCRDCDREFPFTIGEQDFYASRGFSNEPGRCPECRANRRAQSSDGERGRREMHPVVCAECGQQTQVPFLPRGDRPVYCSNCFDKVRSAAQ